MEKKSTILSKMKESFHSKKFKGGAYITISTVLVIGLILFINVIFSELDMKFDLSSHNMYSLTKETEEFVSNIKDDISIYYLARTGEANDMYSKIVNQYDSLSKSVKVEYKDPIQYPKFASQYIQETIRTDSVLVVNHSNQRVKYVDASKFPTYSYDTTTYQQYQTGIDVEGKVTQALSYVTKEVLPMVYEVTGHGEIPLGDTAIDGLDRSNISLSSLSLLTTEEIPEDCKVLLINTPQSDFTEEESAFVKEYLIKGGKAVILVNDASMKLSNFKSILSYYGVEVVGGLIVEGNKNNYVGQYVNYLLPNIESHEITSTIKSAGKYVVMPEVKGFSILESMRSTITINPLLVTSDDAFSKVNLSDTTITKMDGDIEGPFHVAIEIVEDYNNVQSNIILIGSPYLIDEGLVGNNSSYGNLDLFIKSVSYLAGEEESISVPAKTLTQNYLTMTAFQYMTIASVVVIALPVLVLAVGAYVCIRRRRK